MDTPKGKKINTYGPEKLKEIFDQAPVGILIIDKELGVIHVNQSLIKFGTLYRLNLNDIEGTDLSANTVFNIKEELRELKNGLPFEKTLDIVTTSKKKVVVVIKGTPLFEDYNFSGGILILEDLDITRKKDEEEELKSTDLEYALNNLNNFLFITDELGEIKYVYGKDIGKLNRPGRDVTGSNILELFPESVKENLRKQISISREKRMPSRGTCELRFGKETSMYECRTEPLVNEKGRVHYIFFVFNEITGYLSYASKLEEENRELKQYRTFLEEETDGVISLDLNGNINFWNNAARDLFGLTRDEVLNTFFGKLAGFTEEDFNELTSELHHKNSAERNLSFIQKNNGRKIINAKFTLSKGDTIFVLCSDVTEKVNIEQQLNKSEEKYRNIADNTGALILNLNSEGKITYSNPAFQTLLNFRGGDLISRNIKSLLSPGSAFPDLKKIPFEESSIYDISLTGRKRNIELQAYITPVRSKEGQVYYNFVAAEVSVFKQQQKDLVIFRSMFQFSKDGVALESGRKIILANKTFASTFGYPGEEEMTDRDILDLIAPNDILKAAEYFQLLEQKKADPHRTEFMGKRRDGTTFFMEVTVSLFSAEKRDYRLIVARDITDRKQAQQEIRESEEKYRNITDNIDDFLYTYERAGKTLVASFYTSSVERVTGYTQSDFLKDSKLFLKIVHPDDFQLVKGKIKNLLKSRIQISEEFEFRILNRHGNVVWVRNKINIVRSGDRQIQKIYGLVSDISLRKRAEDELKVSTGNLIKLNETKDKFISIISHDLRTPFSSILGFTDLILSDDSLTDDEKKQYVSFIRESSKSMLSLVNSLLDWTRLQTGRFRFEPNRIEAATLIESSRNLLSGAAFQKKIKINSSVPADQFIFVDKSLVLQIFSNLLTNAIKFTRPGGLIEIFSFPSTELRFIEFVVKDNGIGIAEGNINKLFSVEAKFTSEGTAGEKGSGLGLSLVKDIVEKHGGTISVKSQPGEGTEFHFTLPVAPATILLVDDSKTDRLLYSKILKNITPDYNIQIASNGKEAIESIERTPPALVVSDHLMPVMNGVEFVQALQRSEIKGKPPVIILSSELDRHIIQDYNELGIDYVFQKPVNLMSFKQAVEKSLRKGLI